MMAGSRTSPSIMASEHFSRRLLVMAGTFTVLAVGVMLRPRGGAWSVALVGVLLLGLGLVRLARSPRLSGAQGVLFERTTDGVIVVDEQASIVAVNPAASRILRVTSDEAAGRSLETFAATAGFTLPEATAPIALVEQRYQDEDPRWYEITRHAINVSAVTATGTLYLLRDVTDAQLRTCDVAAAASKLERQVNELTATHRLELDQRLATEAVLRQDERRYRAIFEQSFQLVTVTDPQGIVVDANRSALALINAELREVTGRQIEATPWWAHAPEQAHRLRTALTAAAQGVFVRYETTINSADAAEGGPRNVDFSLKPLKNDDGNVILVILEGRDITELKQSEAARVSLAAELHQTQHLEALGQLTRQLLTFSRRQAAEPRVFSPAESLTGLRKLLPHVVGEDISLQVSVMGDPGKLFLDPAQFDQIVINLIVNARDAMPSGGQLDVTLGRIDVNDPMALPRGPDQIGSYVLLTVADTGTGIPESIIHQIFEPFFTTKAASAGTGLGLATVHGVVTQASGAVTVESKLGWGTTFRVYLPNCDVAPPSSRKSVEAEVVPPLSGTILLVEDQASVRELVVRVLSDAGLQISAHASAATALEYAQVAEHEIDLVLTDVVMPKMDGQTMTQALRQTRPSVPVVFMSGHHDDTMLRPETTSAREFFLPKPFTPRGLLDKLRAILESS